MRKKFDIRSEFKILEVYIYYQKTEMGYVDAVRLYGYIHKLVNNKDHNSFVYFAMSYNNLYKTKYDLDKLHKIYEGLMKKESPLIKNWIDVVKK